MNAVMPTGAEAIEIQRDMHILSKRANFTGMFRRICMDADLEERLRKEEEK